MENELLLKILETQEAMVSELKTVNRRLDTLEQSVNTLEQSVNTLEQNVNTLEQGQQSLSQSINTLAHGQDAIRKQQLKDSALLQSVFDQTIKLTENKVDIDTKLEKIKSIL